MFKILFFGGKNMITEFVKKHGKTIATVVAPAIGAAIGSVCQIIM